MKTIRLPARFQISPGLFAVVFFASASLAIAVDREKWPMVEVESVFIAAPAALVEEALGTIPRKAGLSTILEPGEWKRVRDFLVEHQARIVAEPSLITKSGQRALAESVREFRFPSKHLESKSEPGQWIPTEFATRNIGVTLEVEPVVGPESAIDLNIVPQITEFFGFIDYTAAKDGKAPGKDAIASLLTAPLRAGGMWQPVFATRKVQTSIMLRSGETALLGVLAADKATTQNEIEADPENTAQIYVFVTARTGRDQP